MKNFCYLSSKQPLLKIYLGLSASLLLSACSGMAPPTEQMAVSKVSITNASAAGGNEFAPVQLKTAMDKMDAADQAMAAEDYKQAKQLAEQAQVDAKLAAATARSVRAQKAAGTVEESNRVLHQELDRKTQ